MGRTYTEIERKYETKELTSMKCCRCDKEMLAVPGKPTGEIFSPQHEGTSFDISFGYGSTHDLEHWVYDLCDDCCDALLEWAQPLDRTHDGIAWDVYNA